MQMNIRVVSVFLLQRVLLEGMKKNGEDYFFRTQPQFKELLDAGAFVEWYENKQTGFFYGTLRSELEKEDIKNVVILDMEIKGAVQMLKLYREQTIVFFFTAPDSYRKILLQKRGSDTDIAERLIRPLEDMALLSAHKKDMNVISVEHRSMYDIHQEIVTTLNRKQLLLTFKAFSQQPSQPLPQTSCL